MNRLINSFYFSFTGNDFLRKFAPTLQLRHSIFFCLALACIIFRVQAQQDSALRAKARQDSANLPFAICDEKKLCDEDLQNKKEGAYAAGVPDISSDPVNGLGFGVEGELYFNGKRSNPFFAFTPYKYKLSGVIFVTTRNQKEFALNFDAPYIFRTKWRLRLGSVFETNPNRLFFGTDSKTLQPLTAPNDPSRTFSRYKDYTNYLQRTRAGKAGEALVVTDFFYNTFTQEEVVSNINLERSFLDGKMRLMIGYELGIVSITTFDKAPYSHATDSLGNEVTAVNGETRLTQDNNQGLVRGVGTNVLGMTQAGIIYDTRDLESDPGKGIFAEITNETSAKALGSIWNFTKTFFHVKGYKNILPNRYKKIVLAARAGLVINSGQLPFYENYDCYSSEGSIEALGGPRTLRGYKQWRFTGPLIYFTNLEARIRLFQTKFLKQHLAFGAVPFFDAGSVSNTFRNLFNASDVRYSGGAGIRIAWNVNTILRFDYAISKEDGQFFFQFGHAF